MERTIQMVNYRLISLALTKEQMVVSAIASTPQDAVRLFCRWPQLPAFMLH
ncbi:hypothetical protein [Escherichia coli]